MTDWQWKVIISLARTVLELHKDNKQGIIGLQDNEHISTLKEAVRIEDGKQS